MQQSQYCPTHNKPWVSLCLQQKCTQNRLGCEKCLLKFHGNHLGNCVMLQDLQNKEQINALLMNDQNEQSIIHFVEDELIYSEKIDLVAQQINQFFKSNMKEMKSNLLQQETKQKSANRKRTKEIIETYANSFEMLSLKDKFQQFSQGLLSQEDMNKYISTSIQEKQYLTQQHQNKKLAISKSSLQSEFKSQIIAQVEDSLNSLKNMIKKDDAITFQISPLSQEEDANIIESIKGKQFIFNEEDEIQLIYGSCLISKGIFEFQIAVQYTAKEVKEEKSDLDSMILPNTSFGVKTQNSIGGHISNTGLFSTEEYKHLNRLYIGVVEDQAKENASTYSILYHSNQCCAVDIIRGQPVGQFHMKQQVGEKSEQISAVFKKQMKEGLLLTFKINLNEKKVQLVDSENLLKYEGQLANMGDDNFRPYILAYKSNIKVTIN